MGIVFGKTGVAEPVFDCLLSRSSPLPYEIRKYGVRYACETEYSTSSGNDGMGFRALAGYIGVGTKPQNDGETSISMTAPVVTAEKKGESIAMTAPVVTEGIGGGMKKMQFVLPAKYDSMDKIPKPTNPNVKITKVPAASGAVHTFSGSCNDEKGRVQVQKLIEQLKEDGMEIDEGKALENSLLWQYNPPFTIPTLRRNEVWVDLSESQVDFLVNKFNN